MERAETDLLGDVLQRRLLEDMRVEEMNRPLDPTIVLR
jgi:hypothetical protein